MLQQGAPRGTAGSADIAARGLPSLVKHNCLVFGQLAHILNEVVGRHVYGARNSPCAVLFGRPDVHHQGLRRSFEQLPRFRCPNQRGLLLVGLGFAATAQRRLRPAEEARRRARSKQIARPCAGFRARSP